jgi:ABC-type nickel/cobalt efflux system permease component RcnA
MSMLALGFALGLRHAVEADHIAAVSTIASERKTTMGAALAGTFWGIGHAVALMIAGVAVLVLRIQIGEQTARALELGVAVMLVGLGTNALWKLARGGRVHTHPHAHGSVVHDHPHVHENGRLGEHGHVRQSARPLLIGMVHGMAGSAALMLLVLATVSSPVVGLAYVGVFGVGSIAGMTLMSALISLPVRLTAHRYAYAESAMRCIAGLFGVGFGLYLAYSLAFE